MKSHKFHHCNRYGLLICVLTLVFCLNACGPRSEPAKPIPIQDDIIRQSENAVHVNTASAAELETLPYIGPKLALKIVEHRERYGPFRRAEHLMLIQGISDSRFRQIRAFVRVN